MHSDALPAPSDAAAGPSPFPTCEVQPVPGVAKTHLARPRGSIEDLAYKGQPGKPKGMLVFDVELVSIKKGTPAPTAAPKTPDQAKPKAE